MIKWLLKGRRFGCGILESGMDTFFAEVGDTVAITGVLGAVAKQMRRRSCGKGLTCKKQVCIFFCAACQCAIYIFLPLMCNVYILESYTLDFLLTIL